MARRPIQPDLFAALEPTGSDPEGLAPAPVETPIPPFKPDLDDARARLNRILGEARAAGKLPWDKERIVVYRAVVPHMIGWFPEDERARFRSEFETELAWLAAASQTRSKSAA
jgi:hypothetical protein